MTATEPLVSVVIPTRDRTAYLREAIESVLRQSYTRWELMVVDDGSTDETPALLERYARRDSRIRYASQQNRGTPAARNHAIQLTQGEFIAFLDDDDRWLPEKLERQVRYLCSHPEAGGVFVMAHVIDGEGRPTHRLLCERVEASTKALLERGDTWVPSQMMVRRTCLERVGLFDEQLHITPDRELWIRLLKQFSIHQIAEPLTEYRFHPGNMSSRRVGVMEDWIRTFRKHRADPGPGCSREAVRNRIARLHYILAWFYADDRSYAKAAAHFLQATLTWPTVGLHVTRQCTRPRWYCLIAPYLGAGYMCLRALSQRLVSMRRARRITTA